MTRKPRTSFDHEYYERFYRDPETRAFERSDTESLVLSVMYCLRRLGVPVRTVLDVGCGLGLWKQPLGRYDPRIRYTGVETSLYLRRKYGWKSGSITTFKSSRKYDLVICQSVLQYLPARDARAALRNLASLCAGAMYLEIVTKEDWEENCDRRSTDGHIYLRTAAWYRKEILKYFTSCGGGVFLPNDSPVVLYELEKMDGP